MKKREKEKNKLKLIDLVEKVLKHNHNDSNEIYAKLTNFKCFLKTFPTVFSDEIKTIPNSHFEIDILTGKICALDCIIQDREDNTDDRIKQTIYDLANTELYFQWDKIKSEIENKMLINDNVIRIFLCNFPHLFSKERKLLEDDYYYVDNDGFCIGKLLGL
jgi:hypothetical protein